MGTAIGDADDEQAGQRAVTASAPDFASAATAHAAVQEATVPGHRASYHAKCMESATVPILPSEDSG
jgi:hypothetical protein